MKRSKEAEDKIRRVIRDAIALDPLISLRSLQDVLQRKNYNVGDLNYISKLRKKVEAEARTKTDRSEIVERITQTKERYRLIFQKLNQIAFWTPDPTNPQQPPSYKDQIAALKAIGMMDLALISAEMDAGIFTRHLGLVEQERRFVPLPTEQVELIMNAFKAWGIGPTAMPSAALNGPRQVEAKVVKVFNIKPANHAEPSKQPTIAATTTGPSVVGK